MRVPVLLQLLHLFGISRNLRHTLMVEGEGERAFALCVFLFLSGGEGLRCKDCVLARVVLVPRVHHRCPGMPPSLLLPLLAIGQSAVAGRKE